MTLENGTRLGPYEIVGPLGAGGMGEVYRARDTRLGREVAVKVLPEKTAGDASALVRFQREARAVAALSHPNILAIYDIGEEGGMAYAVMELLEGETILESLRDSEFGWRKAVDVSVDVADALAAAHERGIVHRDLKPANIFMTTDGVVKVLDFGLAQFEIDAAPQDRADSVTATLDTKPGVAVGTLCYMSPEQLRGHDVDTRSDLFAFGCVLYEMLTARRAFAGDTAVDTMMAVLRDPPGNMGGAGTTVPLELERLVLRCLEKKPAQRFQSARDLAFALRTLATAASDSGVARRPPDHERKIAALAVLPLRNLAGDPEQDFFADGMTEALIADLSGIGDVRVISRTSAMQYKGVTRPLPAIARELNVDAIVEGSVLRAGSRVRITVELVHAASDTNLWARSYERDLEDILALQSELARAIVREIRGKLNPPTRARLAASRQVDPQAYEAYLKGRFHWNRRTEETLRKGIDFFNKAIEIDPTWALAYAGLADSYNILGFYFYSPPKQAFPRATAAAQRALELDEHLIEAYALLGYTELYHGWRWPEAEAHFRRTLAHNPNSAEAHRYYANFLTARGRLEQAAREIDEACRLDPLSLINSAAVGWVSYFQRDYERALEGLRKTQDLDRTFAPGRLYKGWVLLQMSRFDAALVELAKANEYAGQVPLTEACLAYGHAVAGNPDEARRLLVGLQGQLDRRYVSAFLVGLVHLGLGDVDATFQWLDRACEERSHWLVFMDVDPRFDPIRDDARFQALRRRTSLGGCR